ncbi:MAG: beta-lactamase family protein [Candidatus Aminicenantes bacterium]|nr:beta-lactamase family protein [Candidatus Aminicenantes bacterium]
MNGSRRSAFFLVVLVIFPALNAREGRCSGFGGCQVAARKDESRIQSSKDLEAFFRAQIDDFKLAGIGACIVKDGQLIWSDGFGLADIEEKRPDKPDTIFSVGSVSKTVTLAAFMRLWEQGKCALDDDINRYLSFPVRNPRFPDKPVTIRMLLSFTSGIFDVDFQAGQNRLSFLAENRDSKTPAEEALREFLVPGGKYYSDQNYLESAPGERYAYSNSSYSLIGCVIERLSGRPFWEYCRENIFIPLRMNDSSWRLADLDRDRFAYEYVKESGRMKKAEPSTWPGYMDGGLQTTTKDFGNFLIMMMNRGRFEDRQILRPKTVDAMLALQSPQGAPQGRGFPTIGRGFVWVLSQIKDRQIFQMNGFGPTFFAQVYFDPARKIGGAFFTTGGFDSFQALGNAVQSFFDKMLEVTDRL